MTVDIFLLIEETEDNRWLCHRDSEGADDLLEIKSIVLEESTADQLGKLLNRSANRPHMERLAKFISDNLGRKARIISVA